MAGRSEHFDAGSGLRPLKTRYRVQEVGMVPPPRPRGYGQIDPELLGKLRQHSVDMQAVPPTTVDLRAPVRASQATVEKRKVDRIPRNAGKGPRSPISGPHDLPKAAPFQGGVHLYDGHHRTAYAMLRGHTELPMAVFDPDNPQHVEHARTVVERLRAVNDPLNDHRREVIQKYRFHGNGMVQGPEADAARARFSEHQAAAMAHMERIRHEARLKWQA